jgi:phage tail P2-like protein
VVNSLLPPNATPLENAVGLVLARISDVPRPLEALWSATDCPLVALPWLGWGLSVDVWRLNWTEAQKRDAVATAIPEARRKGTVGAVRRVMAVYDSQLSLKRWWEYGGIPHTFTVTLPLDGNGGARSTARFARDLHEDITRVKPARSHFQLRQSLASVVALPFAVAAHPYRMDRLRAVAVQPFDELFLAESGDPLLAEDGTLLEIE